MNKVIAQSPSINYQLLDPNVIEDPYPFYRALVSEVPVYQVPGTEVYLVSSWELIHQVLKNQEDYSANLTGILVTAPMSARTVRLHPVWRHRRRHCQCG